MNTAPTIILCSAALALGAFVSPAHAHQPATRLSASSTPVSIPLRILITRSLERRTVRAIEWTSAGVRVAPASVPEELAAESAREIIPLADILAMVPPAGELLAAASARAAETRDPRPGVPELARLRVTLTDGQRYVGNIDPSVMPAAPSGQNAAEIPLGLKTSMFGDLRFMLDQVVSVETVVAPDSPRPAHENASDAAPPSTDRVVLVNGDRINGFVESIGPDVVIGPETGKDSKTPQRIPLSRCRSIQIANPAVPLAGAAVWVGGPAGEVQVIRAAELTIRPGGEALLRPQLPGDSVSTLSIPASSILALTPDASRIVPLSRLGLPQFTPDPSRRWSQPPVVDRGLRAPLGLGEVLLPGPMSVEWTLPAGVTAITGSVALAPEARLWGDCNVAVELVPSAGAPVTLWKGRLNGEHAREDVTAPVKPASDPSAAPTRLRVRVEAGSQDQIQDRVVLEGFMLVVTPPDRPAG